MAITLRFTDEQERILEDLMVRLDSATKSKALLYLLDNSDSFLSAHDDLIALKRLLNSKQQIENSIEIILSRS